MGIRNSNKFKQIYNFRIGGRLPPTMYFTEHIKPYVQTNKFTNESNTLRGNIMSILMIIYDS